MFDILRPCSTHLLYVPQKPGSQRCQSQTFPPSSGRSQALVLAGFSKERLPRLRQIHLGHVKVTASPLTIMAFWGAEMAWCGYRRSIKRRILDVDNMRSYEIIYDNIWDNMRLWDYMGIYRIKLDNKYNNDSAVDVGVPTFHTVLQYPGQPGFQWSRFSCRPSRSNPGCHRCPCCFFELCPSPSLISRGRTRDHPMLEE